MERLLRVCLRDCLAVEGSEGGARRLGGWNHVSTSLQDDEIRDCFIPLQRYHGTQATSAWARESNKFESDGLLIDEAQELGQTRVLNGRHGRR